MNAVQVLPVRNVWTIARAILSDSIALKHVDVGIKRNVINRMEVVRARKVGPVLIVVRETVRTICLDLIVKILVSATLTIRICAIHGLVNVIVKRDGVAVSVIDLVRF